MKPAIALLSGTLIGSTLISEGLLAAEWQREAGVTVGAYASDNICLSAIDHQAWSAATVTPDIYARGHGDRANIYLEAALEYNTLAHSSLRCTGGQGSAGSNREVLTPRLRYLGNFELVEDWMTLESNAFIGRNPVDPFAAGGMDSTSGLDNLNITYHYGAGALIQRRLFNSADMQLRVNHNEQHNSVSLFGDSSENRGEFDIGTERDSNVFSMGVAGRYSKVMHEGNNRVAAFDNTLSSAEVRAALQLGPTLQINGLVGEEWNEFTSVRPEIDGSFWDAGLQWTPNDRVEVAVGTGERFFGTTPRMNIRYRHKRSELTASYARTLMFPRDLRIAESGINSPFNFDPDFDPAYDPDFDTDVGTEQDFDRVPGSPLALSGETTFIGNTPIINERLSIRYRFNSARTRITVFATNSEQLRTEDLAEATFSNLGVRFTRSLNESLSANVHLSWSEADGQGITLGIFGQSSQTWRAGFGMSRRLDINTTMSLGYQHTRRESDFAFNHYNENRVTLSARHQF